MHPKAPTIRAVSGIAGSSTFGLIDDDRHFAETLRRTVAKLYPGITTRSWHSARQALTDIKDIPDLRLLFLDYRMPDMNGAMVLDELRTLGRELVVIIVTGHGDEQLAADLLRMGADDYLVKAGLNASRVQRAVDSSLGRLALRSELRRTELELRNLSELLRNVTHELRTPLNAVLGYAGLLSQGVYGPITRRQEETLDALTGRAEDLSALIEQILTYSRLEAERMPVSSDYFDPTELFREVLDTGRVLARVTAGEGDAIELRAPQGERFPALCCDRAMLKQILLNLIGNAVKFTQEGIVELRCRETLTGIIIEVNDSGPGIPLTYLEKIFEPFQQVDPSATRRHGGSGLGLTISRRMAELMGGSIEALNRSQGGSTFRLRLPTGLAPDSAL